jgi:hypothetical protein
LNSEQYDREDSVATRDEVLISRLASSTNRQWFSTHIPISLAIICSRRTSSVACSNITSERQHDRTFELFDGTGISCCGYFRPSDPQPCNQIGNCSHNSVISPTRILPGHSHDQTLDFLIDGRTSRGPAEPRSIELLGHQFPVPAQQSLRLGSRRHVAQSLASQTMSNFG